MSFIVLLSVMFDLCVVMAPLVWVNHNACFQEHAYVGVAYFFFFAFRTLFYKNAFMLYTRFQYPKSVNIHMGRYAVTLLTTPVMLYVTAHVLFWDIARDSTWEGTSALRNNIIMMFVGKYAQDTLWGLRTVQIAKPRVSGIPYIPPDDTCMFVHHALLIYCYTKAVYYGHTYIVLAFIVTQVTSIFVYAVHIKFLFITPLLQFLYHIMMLGLMWSHFAIRILWMTCIVSWHLWTHLHLVNQHVPLPFSYVALCATVCMAALNTYWGGLMLYKASKYLR